MKLNIFIIALLFTHNLSAAQQKPNLKRAGSPIQNLDERPNTRTTTTTSSMQPIQSLDEEDTKMACEQQPSTRTIGTQTDMQMSRNQLVVHELDKYLINAAKAGNLEQIQELFDQENNSIPDINAMMHGKTSLVIATENGNAQIIRFLIDHGAKAKRKQNKDFAYLRATYPPNTINNKDKNGHTLLGRAISRGRVSLVEFLLENDVNPYILTINPYFSDEDTRKEIDAFELAKLSLQIEPDDNGHVIAKLLADYEKLQTPEHLAVLQAVAQRSMQSLSRSVRHEGMEEPAMLVQQYLRRDYRGEALERENKAKEEKENKERSSLAPMVDEK